MVVVGKFFYDTQLHRKIKFIKLRKFINIQHNTVNNFVVGK